MFLLHFSASGHRSRILWVRRPNHLSLAVKDKSKYERCLAEPNRYTGSVRIGTGLSLMTATKCIQEWIPTLTFPMLILQGSDDVVTSPMLAQALFDGAASTDKTLIVQEGGWHSLWFEPPASVSHTLHDVLQWLNARVGLPKGAVTAAVSVRRSAAELEIPHPHTSHLVYRLREPMDARTVHSDDDTARTVASEELTPEAAVMALGLQCTHDILVTAE